METGWLLDFVTLAEVNNFTRAAEIRHCSQAAFSRRIKALEAWTGVELIDRSVFPTRLTAEGTRFLEHAVDIVNRVTEARADLTDRPSDYRSLIRIAAPHALATGMLPGWWQDWTKGIGAMACAVDPANVHDAVTSFVAGQSDFLVCFHNPQQPIHLDAHQYDRLTIGTQMLQPYASPALLRTARWQFPGTTSMPFPVLAYSPGAYLGKMVSVLSDRPAPKPCMIRVAESDMADVLREMALAGHGVAWLPDCVASKAVQSGSLVCVSEHVKWKVQLSVLVYRDRANSRAAVQRLWNRLYGLYA